jgi:hypothetical protein
VRCGYACCRLLSILAAVQLPVSNMLYNSINVKF